MTHTTVALHPKTKELLESVKEETHSKTLDEAIRKMIFKLKKPKRSLAGAFKRKAEFVREEIDRFD